MASFPRSVVQRAWDRQKGLCAGCGKTLVRGNQDKGQWGAWHAHHRKPRDYGGSALLRNCVLLCINEPENCHLNIGHEGNYGNYAQPSDTELPSLYGEETRMKPTLAIPIAPIGFPLFGNASSRKVRRMTTKPRVRRPKPQPSMSIIRPI